MNFLGDNELTDHLESIIHEETQLHDYHFDLTVTQIHRFTMAGALDFGGSEFKSAETEVVELQKNSGDDYGWWHLSEGTYQATMNETLADIEDATAIVVPHSHLHQAGVTSSTSIIPNPDDEPITMNLQVPSVGCNIKENARIASLYLLSN
ncbi:dCTP deaminase [Fodinibius halophilus]|uniref:dCTP deaminase n=1 Tax=Fodinibius halophilus TaxID=1736908 RepID=A0A6M1TAH0_9BACT|nr:dCTP deaminase [Fodinibius halophilus]NGP87974.1 dCTP deaminase [Fodinibius halophilus]